MVSLLSCVVHSYLLKAGRKFSEYYEQLDKYTKERYEEKLNYIGPEVDDPYILPIPAVSCSEFLADVEYPDIYNYLINTLSPVTKEELKAYKSFKYRTAGWVSNVHAYAASAGGSKIIATAYVRHSQSVSQAKLRLWFAAERSGTVICAHCTCMAGLGEACSHISALLFAAESHNQLVKNTTRTSLPCGWLPPTLQNVTYKPGIVGGDDHL